MFTFTKFSFARQFMLMSFLIMLIGMVIIGLFISEQIKIGVTIQTAAVTALYVDSFISPHLQRLAYNEELEEVQISELNRLIEETSLRQQIVAFKVWSPDGQVVYSPNQELIGRYFTSDEDLQRAFEGEVASELSNLDKPEHEFERQYWSQLIETYAPIRADRSGEVIAVSEFYQLPDNLNAQIVSAQFKSWLVVGVSTLLMYILLAGMIGRASNTIKNQQEELSNKVNQLTELLAQNEKLSNRVRRAANRTTALNEHFLHRISSDLHDGPIQDLALALLRIESLSEACGDCQALFSNGRMVMDDFDLIQTALISSMKDIRGISSGIRLPELEQLSPAQVTRRAVRDYRQKTQSEVEASVEDAPDLAPMSLKITLYRVIQEALMNGFRHAEGLGQVVRVWGEHAQLHLEVIDTGTGFDPQELVIGTHLGLAGMRERVEILGGTFSIISSISQGTRVKVILPLDLEDELE